MTKAIYLDMDGTFVDLYGVADWLPQLRAENPAPYINAKPLVNLSNLAKALNKAQAKGYHIGIISWTSKGGSSKYNKAVAEAKKVWIKKHLPSVRFNEITIVDYGTPKAQAVKVKNGILFDDEEQNRKAWAGKAYNVNAIAKTINTVVKAV